jgi:hypothetical protein
VKALFPANASRTSTMRAGDIQGRIVINYQR